MRVLITGGGGFVGRRLAALLAKHHYVIAVDRDHSTVVADKAIVGDLGEAAVLAEAFAEEPEVIVHLATVPGGAAEANPTAAWQVNVDQTFALANAAAACGCRIVFASSIAVFGDPLPSLIGAETPLRPRMLYGAHKAIAEQWLATLSRRGDIDCLSLRLPGIVARPPAPSGMKSAFLSNVFYTMRKKEPFVSPVSPEASMLLMSVDRIATNLAHAVVSPVLCSEPYALNLPALRVSMAELVAEIARQVDVSPDLVTFLPDEALDSVFGRQPPIDGSQAESFGFRSDDGVSELVRSALATMQDG